ncbi:hypothetical protein CIB48_g2019 [Xylaria polymorpha]|nr:hypothetical protein CIB48_g2019 [Xylaria polymorpha]
MTWQFHGQQDNIKMITYIFIIGGIISVLLCLARLYGFYKNIQAAKMIGLPFYLSPFDPVDEFSQVFSFIWIPLWKLIVPKKFWDPIIEACYPGWSYRLGYSIFEKLGHDTFIIVSPRRISFTTANPDIIHQITSKRDAFPKSLESYTLLSLFGHNIITTEGHAWRMHRKLTAPSFNESTLIRAFDESIHQAQGLIKHWTRSRKVKTITTIEQDTLNMAFNIISYLGFGFRIYWSHEKAMSEANFHTIKKSYVDEPEECRMTFRRSVTEVMGSIFLFNLMPEVLLDKVPIKALRRAKVAKDSFHNYITTFLQEKIQSLESGGEASETNLIDGNIKAYYQNAKIQRESGHTKDIKLSDEHVIGNAFILFAAGYETSANLIHFTLLHLANNPAVQREVQKDVDRIFEGTDPMMWTFDEKISLMMASTLGTAMYETLRLMPPVVEIPKIVSPSQDQAIVHQVKSRARLLTWTTGSRGGWNRANLAMQEERVIGADTDGIDDADSTSGYRYKPIPGSFVPFSSAPNYSLENAVDNWVHDDEVERMSREEKSSVYAKAAEQSRDTMRRAYSIITLSLHGSAHVPTWLSKEYTYLL